MPLVDNTWYVNAGDQATTGYYAVPVWTTGAKVAGAIVRQVAPVVNNERLFVCIVAGSSGASEPTWVLTRGAKTTDSTVTWQECTGQAVLNGDTTNATKTAQTRSLAIVLGQVIYDPTTASVQICSTAGTSGSGTPGFSTTKGTTTADTGATWTSLGLASGYSNWANPHARTANSLQATWGGVAGNTVYVASASQEISTVSQVWPNTANNWANPTKVLCVNAAGSMPPAATDLTTGALVAASTAGDVRFNVSGLYVYGVEFRLGNVNLAASIIGYLANSGGTAANCSQVFKNCRFTVGSAAATSGWQFGQTTFNVGGYVEFEDCQIGMVNASQTFFSGIGPAKFIWRNPSGAVGATGISGGIPQFSLFTPTAQSHSLDGYVEGVDLSALSAALFKTPGTISGGNFVFKDCAIRGITGPYVTGSPAGPDVSYVRCDSAGTNYQYMRGQYQGQLLTETSIVRSGGGAIQGTPISWKIVTSANSSWASPFKSPQVMVPNYVVGSSKIITVYGTINAPGLPNNDEVWVEVCYLGSSSSPLGTVKTSTKVSILAASNPVGTDGSTWGGGGSGVGWTPFALATTLTSPNIGMQGGIYVLVKAAKPSTTYYIDPKPVIS